MDLHFANKAQNNLITNQKKNGEEQMIMTKNAKNGWIELDGKIEEYDPIKLDILNYKLRRAERAFYGLNLAKIIIREKKITIDIYNPYITIIDQSIENLAKELKKILVKGKIYITIIEDDKKWQVKITPEKIEKITLRGDKYGKYGKKAYTFKN